MSGPCLVGREATHGTIATNFFSVGNADFKLGQKNRVLEEQRSSQDIHFGVVPGRTWEEFSVKESFVYHDTVGLFLSSALGIPTVTVVDTIFDNVFKLLDDPVSLSFKWDQPRRYLSGFQSLWGVVDKMTFKFEAEGDLLWSSSGIAKAETTITEPTDAFAATVPFNVWECVATLGGGANTRLISGSISISRNRKPRALLDNTQTVSLGIGNRMVEWDLRIDFDALTEYTKFKAATTDALTLVWTLNNVIIGSVSKPTLTLKLGTLAYEEASPDTETDLPTLVAKGKALYNVVDASSIVATLRSSRRFDTC